ncbi:hypothetical protein MMC22_003401 [Lobaria immixta]|nr:hypothetical protein [Lobaria immixta]
MEVPKGKKKPDESKAISAAEKSTNIQARQRIRLTFHLKTLWLFTRSDLKSMIYPNIVFGLVTAMSGPTLRKNQSPNPLVILSNVPYVFLWLWLNLLLFNIANQRLPASILEDAINKPWRPLPSARLDPNQARLLLLIVVPVVFLSSIYLGATVQVLLLLALTWMYNDLGGADDYFIVRNIINALGMACYSSGATTVACGSECELTPVGYQWIGLVGLVVTTTLQIQDMSDQEGDTARGRTTLPLLLGDGFARWTIGGAVMGWSVSVPGFWKTSFAAYVLPFVIGSILAFRVLVLRNVKEDQKTWKMWCIWIGSLYLLPLWSQRV